MDKIPPNILDRAIRWVNPERGLARMRARQMMALAGGYKGARRDRDATRAWPMRPGDADTNTLMDLPTLRQHSSDLVRNSPIAAGAIYTKVTNVVGSGLKLHSGIDGDRLNLTEQQIDDWQSNTEAEFNLWANSHNCDLARRLTFYGHQDLAFRSTLERGDCFIAMPSIERPGAPYGLALQGIEADRVCNENWKRDTATLKAGVRLDASGAPTAYQFVDQHPQSDRGRGSAATWQEITAFGAQTGRKNIIHLYRQLRYEQTRGIPDLAPVMEQLKQLDTYTDAELQAAVVSGLYTGFIHTETGDGMGGLSADEYVRETNEFYKDRDVDMKSGTIVHMFPDDKIDFSNPGRPNASFDPFVVAVLRQIGMALELPYEVLVKHFTASFSAAQAALLEAWKFYRGRREWLAQNLCAPVYENWMSEAVAIGRINAPGFFADPMIRAAYLGASWVGPAREHIDPVKQSKADEIAEDRGWKTAAQNTAERGNDWDRTNRRRGKEERERRENGTAQNDDGQPVSPVQGESDANLPLGATG